MKSEKERISDAIDIALAHGQTDGSHHKSWVIDQIVQALTGDAYDEVIRRYRNGEDGPNTFGWDEGIAP